MCACVYVSHSRWHAYDQDKYFEDVPEQVSEMFPRGLRPEKAKFMKCCFYGMFVDAAE